MYDLHCHLLPDVDDGPATWEQTFALARCLINEGVITVAATPHSYSLQSNQKYNLTHIKRLVGEIHAALQEQALSLTVVAGMEILLGDNLVHRLNNGQLHCYEGTRTLLLETSAYISPDELINAIDELSNNDYRVVLAHPEKIEAVHDDPNILFPLVESGVVMQITAANLVGLNGPRRQHLCEDLIFHGMGHLIASDAHAATGPRSPAMRAGYKAAVTLLGASSARHLVVTIPQLLLLDKPLSTIKPQRIIKRRT